jgi:hypothetical protein
MSPSIIPSSPAVVTCALRTLTPALRPHFPCRSTPPPVRPAWLYAGLFLLLINAPAGVSLFYKEVCNAPVS